MRAAKRLHTEKLLLLFLLCRSIVVIFSYKLPAALVEPLANGFRVSIPGKLKLAPTNSHPDMPNCI